MIQTAATTIENGNSTFAISLSTVIPTILSRLCIKCSFEVKYKLLEFLKGLYLSDAVNRLKYKGVDKLVKYLIEYFSVYEQYKLLPELLNFPIISDTSIRNEYPDPISFIYIDHIEKFNKIKIDTKESDELISFLSENNPKRKIAISRLKNLLDWSLLNKRQQNKFRQALWKSVDENGFPMDTNFYQFAFLTLPYPKEINPQELLHSYIVNTELPIQSKEEKGSGIPITRGNHSIVYNILGTANKEINYQWDKEDVNTLVSKIIEWWSADKEYLKDMRQGLGSSIADEFKARFRNMIRIFSNVILPSVELIDSTYFSKIETLLNELSVYGMPDLEAKVSFIKLFSNKKYMIE
ncbi:hypothetical protein Barb7_00174 [Bacteroidales bacterium Barb7]|nr:hypothetical protein Barb7_00174 [Bacteroidales bacterium Barb7]